MFMFQPYPGSQGPLIAEGAYVRILVPIPCQWQAGLFVPVGTVGVVESEGGSFCHAKYDEDVVLVSCPAVRGSVHVPVSQVEVISTP